MAEIALLMDLVSGPESAGSKAVKLAVPGGEDTTEVFKVGKSSTTGEYFKDPVEGQTVKDALKDPQYEKTRCRPGFPPSAGTFDRRARGMGAGALNRRTNSIALLCEVPPSPATNVDLEDAEIGKDLPSSHGDVGGPGETELITAPQFALRDSMDIAGLANDIRAYSTGQIAFSDALQEASKAFSDGLFPRLRKIFTRPRTDVTYRALRIQPFPGSTRRLGTQPETWMKIGNQEMNDLRKLVKAMQDQFKTMTGKICMMNPDDLHATVTFLYSAPSNFEAEKLSFMEYHTDNSMMSYGASDTLGLNILGPDGKAFGAPVATTSFFGYPGFFPSGARLPPTRHAVFGSKMAQEGRVSIIVTVLDKERLKRLGRPFRL